MKISFVFLFIALYTPAAAGQNLNTGADYIPGQPYVTNEIDIVNLASGGVSINVPLRSFKQQDPISLDYSIQYSSKHLAVGLTDSNPNCQTCNSVWLWNDNSVFQTGNNLDLTDEPQFTGARIVFNQDYRYTSNAGDSSGNGAPILVSPDGGRHVIAEDGYPIDISGYTGLILNSHPLPATTLDRSGVLHTTWFEDNVSSAGGTSVPLYQNRGFPPATVHFDPNDLKPNAIWDTKGLVLPWVDPNTGHVGTSVANTSCPNSGAVTAAFRIDMPAPAGATSTYYLCYSTIHVATNFPVGNPNPIHPLFQADQDLKMLTAVVLPTGLSWQFQYDDRDPGDAQTVNYGTLTKITFPTGGAITYKYASVQPCPVQEQDGTAMSRFIKQRGEYVTPTSAPAVTQYVYTPGTMTTVVSGPDGDIFNAIYTDAVMTVTKPDLSQEIHTLRVDGTTCGGFEDSVEIHDPAGTFLHKEEKGYKPTNGNQVFFHPNAGYYAGEPNYLPAMIRTTLDDGSSWTQFSEYDVVHLLNPNTHLPSSAYASYGNIVRTCVLDYGVAGQLDPATLSYCTTGPVLSRTDTTYAYQTDAGIQSANLPDLLQQQTTYDSNGNSVAATKYQYDGNGVSAPYGSLVEIDEWLNTTNPATWVPQYFAHDSHGMTTSVTDALGHITGITYDATGVYKKTTTGPMTNGMQHASTTIYDPNSDLPISSFGENGADSPSQSTTYHYDGMLRPTSVTLPTVDAGSGGATISYDDTNRIVTASMLQSAGTSVTASQTFDGFGRPVTSTVIDSTGNILTDTTYDLMGRVVSVSNPYRSLGDSTYGLTCTDYDYLGRTTKVRKVAGGSCAVTTGILSLSRQVPFGPITDIYDGAGHHSKQQANAAGQLIKVWEPDTSNLPTLETDYHYDALGNLTGIHQIGKTGETPVDRRFDYDSLSRLVAVLNPETGNVSSSCTGAHGSWSLCYSYDNVGNLTSKVDARLIKTSFSYDALNRVTSKSYANADGTPEATNTPSTCFSYDTPTSTGSNFKGLLSAEWTQRGTCASSTPTQALSSRKVTGYDALGRITSEQRCVLTVCKFSGTYTYDLAGNLTQFGNGSTASILHTFDLANRLSGVSLLTLIAPSLTPQATPIYAVRSFSPAGPSVIDIGSSMTKVRSYDPALRLTGEKTLNKE